VKDEPSRSLFEMMPISGSFFEKLGAHQTMLLDVARCEAYRRAITRVVDAESVVVDIGAGTGLLAFFAAQAGARKVYALESTAVAHLAAEIVDANRLNDRIEIIVGDSRDVVLPELATVVVSETIGFWGIDEGVIEILRDARIRHCTQTAVIVPRRLRLHLVPMEYPGAWEPIDFWQRRPYGFDFSPVARRARNNVYIRTTVRDGRPLALPVVAGDFVLGVSEGEEFVLEVSFANLSRGTMHGFAGWFWLELVDEIVLTTAPEGETLHWRQCFFPLPEALPLRGGETIRCVMSARIGRASLSFSWRTLTVGCDGAEESVFDASTDKVS